MQGFFAKKPKNLLAEHPPAKLCGPLGNFFSSGTFWLR